MKTKQFQAELSEAESDKLLPPIYNVEILEEESKVSCLSQLPAPNGAINQQVIISRVIRNDRITAEDHFQDTRHIVLDVPKELKYEPGDVVMVQPRNDLSVVAEMVRRFGLRPEQKIKITLDQA